MKRLTLPVKGMYCSHCSKAVEAALLSVGVHGEVDLTHNRVSFTYDETKISLDLLRRAVKRAGYDLVIDPKRKFDFSLVTLSIALVVLLFSVFGMIHHLGAEDPFFSFFGNDLSFFVLATFALLFLGTPFVIRAVKGIRYRNFGMDFLIAFSSLVSYGLSLYCLIRNLQNGFSPTEMPMKDPGYLPTYFDSTTMILSIITLGHRLIDQIKTNADKNYEKAVLEPPKTAHRLSGAESEDIDVDYLDVDDLVLVKTGEMIPVDGNVEEGIGYVDESSLTGESRERLVAPGDTLFGGTLLTSGPLRMKVSKIALDSLYSSIINEAYVLDQRKGRLSRISDRIAGIFTPAILLVSLVSFFIAFYGLGLSAENSVLRAVAVLCVSCPCAFGLAVPISAMSGYDRALRSGILFKTGDTFERIRKVKAIVFDKTGTLSTGHPVLTGRAGEDSYLPLVKAMEKASLHPLAKALLESLRNVEEKEITGVQEIPGVGVSYGNYVLGNLTTAEGKEKKEAIVRFLAENASSSLVLLSDEKEVLLAFAFTDALEGSAEDTVRKLREAGIQSYMLTGDRKEDAEKIAAEAGIPPEHVYSEASPKDKARILREIREKEGVIGYVGDGINDTLALKESDLSFASYQACSIAASSADALLLKPDLHTILYALKVSEKTYRNIVENFLWAIVYNASMIPLAILGILSPSLGALLMIVSNLTLTLNSLRIRLYRPEKEKQK